AALPPPHPTAAERELARSVVPGTDEAAARWAAASMELGALVCTARAPRCAECPVAALCAWRAAGYPADEHAGRRRTPAWHGPVPLEIVEQLEAPRDQLARCLDSLVADGLARLDESTDPPAVTLP